MEQSEKIEALAAALAKAQGKIEGAARTATNPHLRSKYADLASVWDAVRGPLSENGLSIVQMPSTVIDDGGKMHLCLSTTLMHSTGQWMRDTFEMPLTKQDAQGVGSALTYARRYALMAVVGVAPDDDDGHAASNGGGTRNTTTQQAARTSKQATQETTNPPAAAPQPDRVAVLKKKYTDTCTTIAKSIERAPKAILDEGHALAKEWYGVAKISDLDDLLFEEFIGRLTDELAPVGASA